MSIEAYVRKDPIDGDWGYKIKDGVIEYDSEWGFGSKASAIREARKAKAKYVSQNKKSDGWEKVE